MKYLLLSICSFFLWACVSEKKPHYDLIIYNGNVIDLNSGAIEKQDIFITHDTIVKVLPASGDSKYSSTQKIDAKGLYILPGFWDNHVHFRGGDSLINNNKNFLKLFIANGVTTVRDAGGDLTTSVMQWKEEMANGSLIGPTIFTSGPKIDGPDPTWAGSLAVSNVTDIDNALDSLEQLNVDFVKLYDSKISGENYIATIAAAEKRGLLTSGHMPFTVTLEETVDVGIDAIEHLYYIMKGCSSLEKEVTQQLLNEQIGFWQAMPALMESYNDTTASATFALLKQKNVFVVPTLHIGKTLSYLDEVDHSNDSYLKFMGKGIMDTYKGRITRAMNASEKARKDRKTLDVFFGRLTKSLSDAGVSLLAGSDSGAFNSYTYPGVSIHKEMEVMVNVGISPLKALQTSAYNGALFFQKETHYGSVSDGKIADLVLLQANPLEDITNTQNIAYVIQGDVIHDRGKLKDLLENAVIP